MRRHIVYLTAIVLVLLALAPVPALAVEGNVVFTVGSDTYYINGLAGKMDAVPFVESGRTFVPVRYLSAGLGVPIRWDEAKERVEMPIPYSEDATIFVLMEGDKNIYVESPIGTGGVPSPHKEMDVAPVIRDGRMYLPARYIAELYRYQVGWDDATQSVLIGPPGKLLQPPRAKVPVASAEDRAVQIVADAYYNGSTDRLRRFGQIYPGRDVYLIEHLVYAGSDMPSIEDAFLVDTNSGKIIKRLYGGGSVDEFWLWVDAFKKTGNPPE
ncbi:MAG: hypothetical protein A4E55_02387 [Pelotomaculum sp. PtaU1.Bin035]|nr:MAG: hypothetical protein A4E55_02387 [Pelotomaculum sp. PtaU1.Bin035]